MVVDLKTLRKHPGRNPEYEQKMEERREAQKHNKSAREFNTRAMAMGEAVRMPLVPVPRQPNKYVPHQGKKEMLRHGDR